jgi:hypothetical protein
LLGLWRKHHFQSTFPEQLQQASTFDGDAPRLVLRQRFGLQRFGLDTGQLPAPASMK